MTWRLTSSRLALAAIVAMGGCGDDDSASKASAETVAPGSSAAEATPTGPPSQLEAFKREASVAGLLELLALSHQQLRDRVGPHTIAYQAHFELAPQNPSELPAKVDQPIEVAFDVDDELELRWDLPKSGVPRAWLRQQNNREDRRELILLDGQAYTRLHEDQWYQRELDGDLHETWFAEAYAAVHDVVEFAAPQLKITGVEERASGPDGAVLEVKLALADSRNEALGRDGANSRWRATSRIDSVSGTLTLDANTGAWRSAQVEVAWRMSDGAQRPLAGKSGIQATLTPGPVEIAAPPDAQPIPERMRYQVERNKLLDGLAAP